MATTTFTTAGVNNLWSNAANWSAGVPANSDTAVIPVGQTCEYDYDMTAFANGVTVQNNGTLEASLTPGSYVLKLAANMTGSGTLRAGTSGTPYPTNCTFQISRNTFEITATSMTLDLNCSEPTVKWCKLSATEAAGQTVLSVDTDLTGYPAYWYDGAILRICDVNYGNDNEERVIAVGGVAASTITITAGLTAQKETGAYVVLISRNVKIVGSAATGNGINGGTGGRIFAEIRTAANALSGANSSAIGGTISGVTNGTTSNTTIGNTISSVISGFTNGLNGGLGHSVSGALIAGGSNGISTGVGFIIASDVVIAGCAAGVTLGTSHLLNGCAVIGCGTGIDRGSVGGVNVTFSNTTDVSALTQSNFYNCAFNGFTEFGSYISANRNIASFVDSIDHDQVAGAYKAWTKGGIVTKVSSPAPTGYDYSYDHACESATYYCFQNFAVTVPAGGGLVVQCEMRKDASMSYLPRVWILLPGVEPFISGSPSYEAIMTNSVDTWETLILVYANSTTAPVTVTVRTVAQNATGHVYTYPINTVLAPATYDVYSTLQSDLDDIQTRLPATLVSNRIDANIGAASANTLTASALAADAVSKIVAAIFQPSVAAHQDDAVENSLTELILAAFKSQRVGDVLTINKTTGGTFSTKDLTLDAAASAVVGID